MYLWCKPTKIKLIFITGIQLVPHREHCTIPLEKPKCECCTEKYPSTSTSTVDIPAAYHNTAQKRTVRTIRVSDLVAYTITTRL